MLGMTCFMLKKLDQVKRWVDEPLAAPVRLHLTLLDFEPLLRFLKHVMFHLQYLFHLFDLLYSIH